VAQAKEFIGSNVTSIELKKQYDLEDEPLGNGSFGKVFRATNKSDPAIKIAVKIINKEGLSLEDL